jgi:hypothetical protein
LEGYAMRLGILALFLCAGATAFCQSAAPAAVNPDELGRIQAAFTQPAWGINKLPLGVHIPNAAPPRVLIRPMAGAAQHWNDAQIDPRMIVHPPPSSLGAQPAGSLVAQNLYPNLRFQPVEWPYLKFQRIPTVWPNLKIGPAASGTPAPARPQGK